MPELVPFLPALARLIGRRQVTSRPARRSRPGLYSANGLARKSRAPELCGARTRDAIICLMWDLPVFFIISNWKASNSGPRQCESAAGLYWKFWFTQSCATMRQSFGFTITGSKNKVFNFVSFLVSRIRLDESIPNLVSEFGAFVPAFGLNKLDKNSITELVRYGYVYTRTVSYL